MIFSQDEEAYYTLTNQLLDYSGGGKQLEFPDVQDEAFETAHRETLLENLKKARRNGQKEVEQRALRLLTVDLLSHQVEMMAAHKAQQNPPSVA